MPLVLSGTILLWDSGRVLFASYESDHHTLAIGLALLAGFIPPKWAGLLKGATTEVGPKRLGSEPLFDHNNIYRT